ncbi:MAG: efflux RND transporter periplasmic adaptor subunit [Poseidonibacter sp.]|uniref:efflux RND transporter periplasmic adaptor subunit n=1 Tax=Poseidonibacter sp. TaxID=2321188 RepID=UPI00359E573F
MKIYYLLFKILVTFILCFNILNAKVYNGLIEPIKRVNLSLSIDGVVSEINIKEGSFVKKDESILKLFDKLQSLEVQRRKVLVDDKTRLFYLRKELKIVGNIYKSSKILYEEAGSISKNELDGYSINYYKLKSSLDELKRSKKLEEIEYKLENEKLKLYTLRAPFNGIITKIILDVGERGRTGDIVVELVDSSTCFVEVNIPEIEVHNISVNQDISIAIERETKKIQKNAKISYISPIADSSSGLVLVKLEFENKDLSIIPGILANVEFNTNK